MSYFEDSADILADEPPPKTDAADTLEGDIRVYLETVKAWALARAEQQRADDRVAACSQRLMDLSIAFERKHGVRVERLVDYLFPQGGR